MRTVRLGDISSMKYGKLPPKDILCDGYPIFTGYRISGYLKEYLFEPSMLVVVARGVGGTGNVKLSPPKSWITNLSIVLTLNEEQVDKRFMYYRLGQEELKAKLDTGSAQSQITIDALSAYEITIPHIDDQKNIVEVLSAYDDLIAANQRRIQLLEESARLFYREWFVKLCFPGHETVPVQDGIPEGWAKKTLGAYATLNYGKGLKESARLDGEVPVYGSSGIVGYHNKPLISGPAIVVGRKGNVGSLYYSHGPCFPIDTVYFISSEQSSYFLYLAMHGLNFISSDAAVPGLNRNYVYSQQLLIPGAEVFTAFEATVQPIFEQINALIIWNEKLHEARDLLLPKLMSGALDVSRINLPQEVAA
jgi:type I restriction enzyme, S subunit